MTARTSAAETGRAMGSISSFSQPCRGGEPVELCHKGDLWRKTNREPVQLTVGEMNSEALPSKDGKEVFFIGATRHGELVRYDAKKTQKFTPYLPGLSAEGVAFFAGWEKNSLRDLSRGCVVGEPDGWQRPAPVEFSSGASRPSRVGLGWEADRVLKPCTRKGFSNHQCLARMKIRNNSHRAIPTNRTRPGRRTEIPWCSAVTPMSCGNQRSRNSTS